MLIEGNMIANLKLEIKDIIDNLNTQEKVAVIKQIFGNDQYINNGQGADREEVLEVMNHNMKIHLITSITRSMSK